MTSPTNMHFKILQGIVRYWTLLIWDLPKVSTPTRPPWGRPCQTPCSHTRRSGCLYTSIKTMTQFCSLFWASNQPCCLLQCSGTCWDTLSPITSLLDLLSLFFFFLDHHTGHPARHDARILLYECILDALWIFFIVVSIYWKLASYRSSLNLSSFGKTTNKSAAKLIYFFFLDPCACYSTCRYLNDFVMTFLRSLRLHIARGLVCSTLIFTFEFN
jgi:hypothetical protein